MPINSNCRTLKGSFNVKNSFIGSLSTLLQALASTGRKADYLSAQMKAFEQELRARDSLLLEIKGEIKRRIEALTVAAQIKQVALPQWIDCD